MTTTTNKDKKELNRKIEATLGVVYDIEAEIYVLGKELQREPTYLLRKRIVKAREDLRGQLLALWYLEVDRVKLLYATGTPHYVRGLLTAKIMFLERLQDRTPAEEDALHQYRVELEALKIKKAPKEIKSEAIRHPMGIPEEINGCSFKDLLVEIQRKTKQQGLTSQELDLELFKEMQPGAWFDGIMEIPGPLVGAGEKVQVAVGGRGTKVIIKSRAGMHCGDSLQNTRGGTRVWFNLMVTRRNGTWSFSRNNKENIIKWYSTVDERWCTCAWGTKFTREMLEDLFKALPEILERAHGLAQKEHDLMEMIDGCKQDIEDSQENMRKLEKELGALRRGE